MNNSVKVIQIDGILDSTKSQEFRDKITAELESGVKTVLVDFKEVTFMDSSGLGALVLAFKALRAANTRLAICSINEQVRIVFQLTGIDKVIEIFTNQDEFHRSINNQDDVNQFTNEF
ncbi:MULTISPECIES: STAS domain-containing protein [Fischerella]|jgi:anti-anti-sigma factor|uniref:Anti-sigma factor antagonist n=4 Tax=Fischerella TaxID=1190 RepID=G6FT34_9CYAN|nr:MULTISPECIES: STAS domain-containing protein [Fischerella]PMB06698.1 anti-sigma factor antagonist [Fischerella thermalis CCMEE 5273]PMB18798.1 anti-sigma factor antagonist [Fischerella thermalis CCMEE 5319]PMB52205.1 anti-sigma factor antagonist [Fischerella thermalis CCMEE 5201]BCX07968.1 MAG: anti-sigma factor antagonist [Fischerella sp.]EHC15020.1 anti-sigma-factor antagonist [Fischerella thermalis JSC-11]